MSPVPGSKRRSRSSLLRSILLYRTARLLRCGPYGLAAFGQVPWRRVVEVVPGTLRVDARLKLRLESDQGIEPRGMLIAVAHYKELRRQAGYVPGRPRALLAVGPYQFSALTYLVENRDLVSGQLGEDQSGRVVLIPDLGQR